MIAESKYGRVIGQDGHISMRLFGATRVTVNGREHVVSARLQRAVLARLARAPQRVVTAEQLLDDCWGDDAPATGVKAVAFQMTKLRSLVEPDRSGVGSFIATDPHGYRLLVEPDRIDVVRFEQLVAAAQIDVDPARRDEAPINSPGAALELWTDDPYGGLEDLPWVVDEIGRLEALRRSVEHGVVRDKMLRGLHREVIVDLAAMIRRDPFDEGLVADLMTSLSTLGRNAEALDAFGALRRRLGSELGLDPSRHLQTLQARLLQVDPESAASPTRRQSVDGNVTPGLDSFVGRAAEAESLDRLLDGHRLVTITGAGGIGKTRLATHVGSRRRAEHCGGVWIARCAPVLDGSDLAAALTDTLGVTSGIAASAVEAAANFLRGRGALLILDNCEHVLRAAGTMALELLDAAPDLKIIATSRESLGAAGENILRLGPLPLTGDDAPALFRDRAGAVRFDFDAFPGADDMIKAICHRVAGIPLGIELAAIRLRSMGLSELVQRLDDVGAFGMAKRGDTRQLTLEATIAWSADSLSADTRNVWRHLSVFAGDCDAEAIEAVVTAGDSMPILDSLDELVDKSLVEARPGLDGSLRFDMLQPIRLQARSELEAPDEFLAVSIAHADFYLELSFRLEPTTRGHGQRHALRRLECESHNIAAARSTLHDLGRHDDELDLCWNLFVAWRANLAQLEGAEMIRRALDDDGQESVRRDPVRVARAAYERAILTLDIGLPSSIAFAQEGIDIAGRLGDLNLLGRLLMAQSCAIQNTTQRTDGIDTFRTGESLVAEHPGRVWWDAEWEAAWFAMMRSAFGPRNDLAVNRRATVEAAEVFGALGDDVHQVFALLVSAFWGIGSEHHEFAMESLETGLDLARRNDLGPVIGHVALFQSSILLSLGDAAEAAPLLREARRHLGDLPSELVALLDDSEHVGAQEPNDQGVPVERSGAATAAAIATAIAGRDSQTAARVRSWATDDPARRPIE